MTTMNISLPESLRRFVETEVTNGGYGNTSEYVRELIRGAQKRQAQEKLEELLLEGLNSGDRIEADDAYWKELRARVSKRLREETDHR